MKVVFYPLAGYNTPETAVEMPDQRVRVGDVIEFFSTYWNVVSIDDGIVYVR